MKLIIVFAAVFLLPYPVFCQNTIGLPAIINHDKQEYTAGTQNWDICQDKNGILYFANNEGLLSFDGVYWKLYPLPNKTIVRSVAIAGDNRIYVGGQDEIGYFSPDARGMLEYHSLKHLIPERNRSFADVWDIVCRGKQVFFRSNNQILQLTGDKVIIYPSSSWLFMGAVADFFIAQDFSEGLLRFDKDTWVPLANVPVLPEGFLVTAIFRGGWDSIFIASLKHGIYLYTGQHLRPFTSANLTTISDYNIYDAIAVDENYFAVATTQKGCFVMDKRGNIVQQFSRHEGLQNNNILSLLSDRNKNLWLGLDRGIDFIAYNSAIKNVFPDKEGEGAGYSSVIFKGRLYIATTNGLFQAPLDSVLNKSDLSFAKSGFSEVKGVKGQVWNLSVVNDKLLVGHHEGYWEVENDQAHLVDKTSGFWAFLPLSPVMPSGQMVAGTYEGLRLYSYKEKRFSKDFARADFESARFIAINNSDVWVSHPYKGIYRVRFSDEGAASAEMFGPDRGLDVPAHGNYVFKVKNSILVTSENGIYELNQATDNFEPSSYFNAIFPGTAIRYMKEDYAGNIWFVFDKALGLVDFSGPDPRVLYIPELNRKMVSGFEQIYPVDPQNIFVGAERGFYHINYTKYRRQYPAMQVHLRQVTTTNKTDRLLFGGYFAEANEFQIQRDRTSVSYDQNSLRFEFAAPLYEQQANIEYSYFLKGYDNNWSDWSGKTDKEYSYLPAGAYQFQVKARNNLGNESETTRYTFIILPPWYQTWWAYALYSCLFVYVAYRGYRWQRNKFHQQRLRYEEKQKRLRDTHQLELEKNEKEIVKLKNEKLEAEIQHKNKEMASATMHLVKKGELITRIKDELQKLSKNISDEKSLDALKKLIKALEEEDKMDADWEHFTIHFDKAHNDFFIALKEKHNNLTPNELKLCAYLRMNLSTKEMAQLMNISVRGVEISRYRLRKKLQIPTETNLFSYLLHFHGNSAPADALHHSG